MNHDDLRRLLDSPAADRWPKDVRARVEALAAATPPQPADVAQLRPRESSEQDASQPPAPPAATTDDDAAAPPPPEDAVVVEGWVGRDELAARFRVAPRTISRYVARGMPCGGRPGAPRFMVSECEAWLGRLADPKPCEGAAKDDREPRRTERSPSKPLGMSSQAFARPSRRRSDAAPPTGPAAGRVPPDAPLTAPAFAPVEPWVEIAAAAIHLACAVEHIEALTQRSDERRIPHRRDGDRLLFKLSQVDAWLDRIAGIQ